MRKGDHKLEAAEAAKREILELYEKDIGKYAKGYAAKVRAIFRTIPGALNSREKKFHLSDLSENARMRRYENAVAQALRAHGMDLLFHSVKDAKSPERTMEVDFLIRNGIKICPIEVKSARCREHVSLDRFIRKYDKRLGLRYVVTSEGYFQENGIEYLPIDMVQLLARQRT